MSGGVVMCSGVAMGWAWLCLGRGYGQGGGHPFSITLMSLRKESWVFLKRLIYKVL